ncbi:hypothetical protein HN587_02965 [Candidatus Woesearchaeota archaeon]|jgi:uncharacterized membrane protein|nr:hypothetical protein [Candidatus Woesearchaeota archaeon]
MTDKNKKLIDISQEDKQFLKKLIPTTAFIAGLCCFTPVVLVLFGLSSVAFAASLSDTLYGTYKWVFRSVALALLLSGLAWYFYKKENVCSLDSLKRKKRRIINVVIIALITGIITYILWLYLVVELIGIGLNIW